MNTRNKLSVSAVVDIRKARALNIATKDIAETYNINPRTVRKVVNGEIHSSIPASQRIKGFSNYEITPDGRVWSNSKSTYLVPRNNKVELRTSTGKRKTFVVSDLMKRYFS